MAVRDDPKSRLKANDAKAAMNLAPATGHAFCLDLMNRHRLQGVVVLVFSRGLIGTSYGCVEPLGGYILSDWIGRVAARAPPHLYSTLSALVLGVRDDGVVDTATWGKSKAECEKIAKWRDEVLEKYLTVAPFTTWFGWGADGVPTPMSAEDLASLSAQQRAWVEKHTRHP